MLDGDQPDEERDHGTGRVPAAERHGDRSRDAEAVERAGRESSAGVN